MTPAPMTAARRTRKGRAGRSGCSTPYPPPFQHAQLFFVSATAPCTRPGGILQIVERQGTMEIRRLRLLEGARAAQGVVVIIDVFRAFTVCAYAAALGARPLVAVADADRARQLKRRLPRAVLSGEVRAWPIPGFDLGNSPSELLRAVAGGLKLARRPFIQRTGAGTQGVIHSRRARRIFVASLANAVATALAIRRLAPPVVTLVAMGRAAEEPTDEDELCAEAIEAYLRGEEWPAGRRLADLFHTRRVQGLLAGELPRFPPSDVALCLAFNLFDFALQARRSGDVAVIRPIRVSEARLYPVSFAPEAGAPPARSVRR